MAGGFTNGFSSGFGSGQVTGVETEGVVLGDAFAASILQEPGVAEGIVFGDSFTVVSSLPTPSPIVAPEITAPSTLFEGLISQEFKDCHVSMITEVIRGCSVACTVIFGVTLYDDCPNCIFDPLGNKSANRWQTGGPAPFSFGNCPMCHGAGKIPHEETVDVDLCPIYDYRSWIPTISSNMRSPEGFMQTVSPFSQYEILVQAKELIVDTAIEESTRQRFERHSKPEPCGIGASSFIATMWKLIENG